MANTQATAVIERLLEDDYVHEQIAAAGEGLRGAYGRARRLPARNAVQDKTLYDRVRQAATGITEAARRAVGKPKPKPPRRRRGLLALVVLAVGAVVFFAAKSRRQAQQGADAPGPGLAQPAPMPTANEPGATRGSSSPLSPPRTDQ